MPLMVGANEMSSVFKTHKFRKYSHSESESDNKYEENPRCVFFISFINSHFKVKKKVSTSLMTATCRL